MKTVFEGKQTPVYETEGVGFDGGRVWFEVRMGPIKQQGEVVAAAIIAIDITGRKDAEAALRESEERWRSLAENAPDYIINVDRDGTILFINHTAPGISLDQAVGHSLYGFLPPENAEALKKGLAHVFETGEIAHYEIEGDDLSGNVAWFAGRIGPIKRDDQVVAAVIIATDITGRKQAEVLLKESEERLRETSRMASVGELAAGVAHEINNPLTVIMGISELLQNENLPEKTRTRINNIFFEADRSSKIVQSLLSFARKLEPNKEYMDLTEVIGKALEMKAHEFSVANIYVTNKAMSGLPRTMADSYQLLEVFLNVLNNAQQVLTEATGGGEIVIESSHSKNRIRISMADNRPGILKENLSRIFDPFFTTKDVGKGTGLGLSMCYGIVRRHDGEMWAESVKGKGATFVMELPIVAPVETEEAAPTVDTAPKSVKRILIVDDEEGIRELFAEVLAPDGHFIDMAKDGHEAWYKVQNSTYDCILMDLKMPGMSGQDLYGQIKAWDKETAGKCIFLTGDTFSPDTHDFIASTGNSSLGKPVSLKQLRKTVLEFQHTESKSTK